MFLYTCSACKVIKLFRSPPAVGDICVVCNGVDTQLRMTITITSRETGEGTDIEAALSIQSEGT